MPSNHPPSRTPPALRIPTIDSMKRFSTTTDTIFTDQPTFNFDFDFNFNTTSDEEPLRLSTYLLDQIDVGQSTNNDIRSGPAAKNNSTAQCEALPPFQFQSMQQANGNSHDSTALEETSTLSPTHHPNTLHIHMPPSNHSRPPVVLFNSPRLPSHVSTSSGITALPTPSSRGLLAGHQDMIDSSAPIATFNKSDTPHNHKSKPSSMKRLRNFSIDGLTAKWHRRQGAKAGAGFSCTHGHHGEGEPNGHTNGHSREERQRRHSHGHGNHKQRPPLKRVLTPRGPVSPFPSPVSSSSSITPVSPVAVTEDNTPTSTSATSAKARFDMNSLATAVVPSYPPSSPPANAPHSSATHFPSLLDGSLVTRSGQMCVLDLPPASVPISLSPNSATPQSPSTPPAANLPHSPNGPDLFSLSLSELREKIRSLQTENQQLKQQADNLREEWYATHQELDLERYKAWKREREWEEWCFREGVRNNEEGMRGKMNGGLQVRNEPGVSCEGGGIPDNTSASGDANEELTPNLKAEARMVIKEEKPSGADISIDGKED